ncbi:MAG: dihydrofolate reductase family protein, partial [Methanofollis liminatans]|nr:dihydrofolate reductase family protein [Methanofollis liminatans]
VVVLVSETTPEDYITYLREREYPFVVCGADRVDLAAAVRELEERFGFARIVSDSGAGLTDALVRAGAADEISLVVTPVVAGAGHTRMFASVDRPVGLELIGATAVGGGRVHLRYKVEKTA